MTLRTPKIAALCAPVKKLLTRALALALLVLALAVCARANTYYIDYASGSNSNSGTSKASPWKSAPTMNHISACDGAISPSGYAHNAGDHFIFKGGVTWPATCFAIFITQGGVAGNPDYYGVDQTWFAGASWTRPLFDFNFQFPSLGNNAIVTNGAAGFQAGVSYLTFDNLEIARQNMHPSTSDIQAGAAMKLGGAFSIYAAVGVTVENMYIHDWVSTDNETVGPPQNVTSYGAVYGASLFTNTETSDANGYYFIGGVKHNEVSGGGCNGCGEMANSKIHDGWIGCSSCGSVYDSEFYNIFGGTDIGIHTHVIYDDALAFQTTFAVYNNAVHDTDPGLVMNLFYHTAIYNNVLWNNANNAAIYLEACPPGATPYAPCGDTTSQVGYVFNNTMDQTISGAGSCYNFYGAGGTGLGTMYTENNICIQGAGGLGVFSVATQHVLNNYNAMNSTEKTAFGFIPANKYKPSSSDSNVSAKGLNQTASCSGNLANLCKDTTGAPWFGGSSITRPTGSTAWDLGDFQGQGGGGSAGPPSISISSPLPGTISGSVNLTASCTPQGSATVSSIQFTIDGNDFGAAGTASPYTLSWNTLTTANGSHAIAAVCTDSNAQTGTAGTVTVTVSNSMPGCFVSGSNTNWNSYQAFTAQTTNFTATFTATPNTNNQDSVVALSQAPMSAYSQGAALVRFNSTGQIDVFKGTLGNYTADATVNYTAGATYAFTFTVNMTAGTYTVALTSPTSVTIATGYTFRTTATSLGYINAISDNTTPDTAQVCSFQILANTSVSFSPTSLSFGNITVGSNSTQSVSVTSIGGGTVFTSATISGSSDFSVTSNTCTGSQSSCSTSVRFAPTGTGVETATLTYVDNASGSPQNVALSGTGQPAISINFNPTSLSFGNVTTSTSASLSVTGTTSGGSVTFTSTALTGSSDFSVFSDACTGTVPTSCVTVIHFTPTSTGVKSGTLTYTDSATASPQSVSISGTGVSPPVLSFSPTSLNFGSLVVGANSTLSIGVTSAGGSTTFSSVAITGSSDFTIDSNACTGSQSSCSTVIKFAPTSAAFETATVSYTDDATGSPLIVGVSGSGTEPSLTFSPSSLGFGNVTLGANSSLTIGVTSSGGATTFSSVGISGSADFTINSNTCSGSVPSSCTTQIKFAPTSAALETATVTYADTATGSPQTVVVSGTGVPATPTLSVSPTSVNFGGVQVHVTSSSGPIVLTISSGPVTFTGTPSLSGPNAADFALASNTCTGTVSSSSCQSVVSFTPSQVAPESATLTYIDSATGSPQQVALTGSGYLAPHPPTAVQATVN